MVEVFDEPWQERLRTAFLALALPAVNSHLLPKGMKAEEFVREMIKRTFDMFGRKWGGLSIRQLSKETTVRSLQHKLSGRVGLDLQELTEVLQRLFAAWGLKEETSRVSSLATFLYKESALHRRKEPGFFLPQRGESFLRQVKASLFPLEESGLQGPSQEDTVALAQTLTVSPRALQEMKVTRTRGEDVTQVLFRVDSIFLTCYQVQIEGNAIVAGETPRQPPHPDEDVLMCLAGRYWMKLGQCKLIGLHGGDRKKIEWAAKGWSLWIE